MGDGVSGNRLWTVVASLELGLGVEMKAGYIIVVVSSSSSFSCCMSKLLLAVVTSLGSPFLLIPSTSSSSNFLLLPSGILFLPRRPGFLPSRLPAPADYWSRKNGRTLSSEEKKKEKKMKQTLSAELSSNGRQKSPHWFSASTQVHLQFKEI